MNIFPNTTIWWNQVFKSLAILSAIAIVIFVGARAHLDPAIIVAIVIPLAANLAQSLPAIEKTKAVSIPPAAIQAVVAEAVKIAVSMAAPPTKSPTVVIVPPLPPPPVDVTADAVRIPTIPAPPPDMTTHLGDPPHE